MPNWCHNQLIITGSPGDLALFVFAVGDGTCGPEQAPEPLSFEHHLPTPQRLLDADKPADGLPEWFVWRRQHWGTKWNVQGAHLDVNESRTSATYRFVTAWSPPGAWLIHMTALFPELSFDHEYVDEFGQLAARVRFAEGEPIERESLEPQSLEWIEWIDEDDQVEESPWE